MATSAGPFEMTVKIGSKAIKVTAVLGVSHCKSQHATNPQDGWRACISFPGTSGHPRLFGVQRNTITETTNSLLDKYSHRITKAEVLRLSKLAAVLQSCLPSSLVTSGSSSQPNNAAAAPSLSIINDMALSQEKQRKTCVHYVHQVYGLFGDDTPMSELFRKSQKMWRGVAGNIGARYHLWNATEVESLMKKHYPDYWSMYCGARYPVMRCHIGRLAILHSYGGLYSDLDCMPNRAWYGQEEFALSHVKKLPNLGRAGTPKLGLAVKKTMKKKRMGLRSTNKVDFRDEYLDMNVIIGSAGNSVFLDWLAYVHQEIASKPSARKKSFRRQACCKKPYAGGDCRQAFCNICYVRHTTGPHSMNQFLKAYRNDVDADIKYLECNCFEEVDWLSENQKRLFDVISYPSQPYQAHAIHVPVGLGDGSLPLLQTTKRLKVKSSSLRMGVSGVDSDCHVIESTSALQATRTDQDAGVDESVVAAVIDAKAVVWMSDLLVDCMATASKQSEAELNDLANEWDGLDCGCNAIKQLYVNSRHTEATEIHLKAMSCELQEWLLGAPL